MIPSDRFYVGHRKAFKGIIMESNSNILTAIISPSYLPINHDSVMSCTVELACPIDPPCNDLCCYCYWGKVHCINIGVCDKEMEVLRVYIS